MTQPASQSSAFFVSGGTLKPAAPSYVERAADQEILDCLLAGDFCYVLTSRQMGKSSLMARTAVKLRAVGVLTAIIDLTGIGEGGQGNQSATTWYYGVARAIARELGLKADLKNWWQARDGLPEQQRFAEFLEDFALGTTTQRIVIFVDEIDATLRLPFTDDFFAGIRACYNARASKPAFERLTFALLGVASPSELIKDTGRTPFNIGHRIELTDFTLKEAGPLTAGFPLPPEEAASALERVLHWTGGQPYLTQRLCLELARRLGTSGARTFLSASAGADDQADTNVRAPSSGIPLPRGGGEGRGEGATQLQVDTLVAELFFASEASRSEVHFKYIRDRLRQDPQARRVLQTYRRVLRGEPVPDNPQSLLHNALKLAGLAERGADGALAVRNLIYRHVFDEHWVRQTLAADPTRRRAFALGVVVMLLVLGPLGYWRLNRSDADLDKALVQALLAARPEAVPEAITNLRPVQSRVLPLLLADFTNAPANAPGKLNAALALAAFGKVDAPFLLESAIQAPPGQCMNITRALEPYKASVLDAIRQRIASAESAQARARLATVALFLRDPNWLQVGLDQLLRLDDMGTLPLGDTRPLEALTARNVNPTNRTTFIHGYREWPGDPLQLAVILQVDRTNSGMADFRSALCAALALVEWKTLATPEQEALVKAMRQLYTESPDGGTHSAAACALTRWGQALPEPPAPTNQPPAGRDWFVNGVGMTMIQIPAGTFNMGYVGCDTNFLDAQPVHSVTLSKPFFISDREVTVEQFRHFTNSVAHDPQTPTLERLSNWAGEATRYSPATNCPVQQVSWFDAIKFCNWLSRQEGRTPCYTATSPTNWQCDLQANGYRLSTEAEWEYACRASSESLFTFGDDEKLLAEYAWYSANSSDRTWPAGSKLPNLWGVFDMHGNLWEWCHDWYATNYYHLSPKDDPTGPENGVRRTVRGGSWVVIDSADMACSFRSNVISPSLRRNYVGFRCVVGVVGPDPRSH